MAALPPTVDSSPLSESRELPVEEEAETDLSPRLPAAHLIGKDLIDLKSPRVPVLLSHS